MALRLSAIQNEYGFKNESIKVRWLLVGLR
jgi:hypothetical protein